MIYCIDTSSLVDWSDYYPPDVFPTLWDKLDWLIAEGRLISSKEVLLELKRQDDDLYRWAASRHSTFIEPDSDTQKCLGDIMARFPTFAPDTTPDGVWADPYLIAMAKTKGYMLVTGEKSAGKGAKHPKIPNVCDAAGVRWCSLLEFIRLEKWQF